MTKNIQIQEAFYDLSGLRVRSWKYHGFFPTPAHNSDMINNHAPWKIMKDKVDKILSGETQKYLGEKMNHLRDKHVVQAIVRDRLLDLVDQSFVEIAGLWIFDCWTQTGTGGDRRSTEPSWMTGPRNHSSWNQEKCPTVPHVTELAEFTIKRLLWDAQAHATCQSYRDRISHGAGTAF
ncbi:unnamed protein product [Caretta caretta]